MLAKSESRAENDLKSGLPFEIEQELLRAKVGKERMFSALFGVIGVGCPLTSLVFKQALEPSTIGVVLGFGLINSGCLIAALKTLKKPESYLKTFEDANKETIKKSIAYDINDNLSFAKIQAQRNLAYKIGKLPDHEHKRWIDMLGLGGILPPPIQQQAVLEPRQNTSIQDVEYDSSNAPDIDEMVQDYEYLPTDDPEFIRESKAVFGNKGSGKSSWMAFEAIQFLVNYPTGLVLIGDIHSDGDIEDSKWLPFIDEETLVKKHLATTSDRIYKQILALGKILKERKLTGLKLGKEGCYPIKFIWDEVLGTLDEWSDLQRETALKVAEQIEMQGRKFGLTCTLGLHSIKKQKSGIDSSTFANMTILAMGDAIADNTIRYPSSFDIPELLKELYAVNATLPEEFVVDKFGMRHAFYPKGLGCVCRIKGKSPQVLVVPPIDLPTRSQYAEANA